MLRKLLLTVVFLATLVVPSVVAHASGPTPQYVTCSSQSIKQVSTGPKQDMGVAGISERTIMYVKVDAVDLTTYCGLMEAVTEVWQTSGQPAEFVWSGIDSFVSPGDCYFCVGPYDALSSPGNVIYVKTKDPNTGSEWVSDPGTNCDYQPHGSVQINGYRMAENTWGTPLVCF